jgi:uncharacterized protein YbjT (DUF2867 family)
MLKGKKLLNLIIFFVLKLIKLFRLIHFSACGVDPDAPSTRLRTKWQGEQEVLKHFPEATIMRPTTIFSNLNTNNFIGQ